MSFKSILNPTMEEYQIPYILAFKPNALKFRELQRPSAFLVTNQPEVPEVLRDYKYTVSALPVVISKNTSEELSNLSVKIAKLIHKIPEYYFGNDTQKIADFYFKGDETYGQFALMCHNKKVEIGTRLDLVLTKNGFKILEANVGSSIGGWQVQSFEPIVRDLHPVLQQRETDFKNINTQKAYIRFLVDKLVLMKDENETNLNLFVSLNNEDNGSGSDQEVSFFSQLVEKELLSRGLSGGAFTGDLSEVHLKGTDLYFGTKRVHGLLTAYYSEIKPAVFRAFITDRLYLPDHLGIVMYNDKRNLALLSALAEKKAFSDEDNKLVERHIPWTRILDTPHVQYNGKTENFETLLKNNRDKFVIKPALGQQGMNVMIGKFTSQDSWEDTIYKAFSTKDYIAQEFSESLDFEMPSAYSEIPTQKMVWGSFGFGNNYGGVWARMSSCENDNGVINSATGAVSAIVYERSI